MNIEINIPDGKIGDAEIQTFHVGRNEISQTISLMKTGRGTPQGSYKRLLINGKTVMSNTPDEIRDFMPFVRQATGSVLINGLGLGVLLTALAIKPEITDITVVEINGNVIRLVAPYIPNNIKIIHCDAFKYMPERGVRYNAVWHDIWNYICSDNIPEMKKLHRKYGRSADMQMSWCRAECERLERQDKANYRFY